MPELRLEPLTQEHHDAFDALLHDPEVPRHTPVPDPVPPGQAQLMLDRYASDETRLGFAALDRDGTFVGMGVVANLDRDAAECELGYMVGPMFRGRGAATELLRLLTRYAFDELKMQRVTLLINVGNDASERVAVRNGYVRDGILRNAYVKPGVRVDTGLWSRLPTDPVS